MNMEILKIEQKRRLLIMEGELDVEFDITGMHPGFPIEDKQHFEKATLELKTYGDILIKDIGDVIKWINKESISTDPGKWPRFKISIERLKD
jgi:hypothetical protein